MVGNEQSSPLPTGLMVRAEQKAFPALPIGYLPGLQQGNCTSVYLVPETGAELLRELHHHKGHHSPLAAFKCI